MCRGCSGNPPVVGRRRSRPVLRAPRRPRWPPLRARGRSDSGALPAHRHWKSRPGRCWWWRRWTGGRREAHAQTLDPRRRWSAHTVRATRRGPHPWVLRRWRAPGASPCRRGNRGRCRLYRAARRSPAARRCDPRERRRGSCAQRRLIPPCAAAYALGLLPAALAHAHRDAHRGAVVAELLAELALQVAAVTGVQEPGGEQHDCRRAGAGHGGEQ